jgi:hypothetical protein
MEEMKKEDRVSLLDLDLSTSRPRPLDLSTSTSLRLSLSSFSASELPSRDGRDPARSPEQQLG